MTRTGYYYLLLLGALLLSSLVIFYAIGPKYELTDNYATSVEDDDDTSSVVVGDEIPPKKILLWTKVFKEESLKLSDCPLADRCTVSYDRKDFNQADAVLLHVPDYNPRDMPPPPTQHHNNNKVYVMVSQETAPNLIIYHNFNKMPRNFFHWTMTFLNSSQVSFPYAGYWTRPDDAKRLGFIPETFESDEQTVLKAKKHKGIFWLVSNCHTPSKREVAVDALSKHIPVDIAGSCAHFSSSLRNACPMGSNCDDTFNSYYFFLALENSICNDYITEKYWSRFSLLSIPIVMKRSIYEGKVPDHSIIAMDDFPNPKAMADHLHFLMDNPKKYMTYFKWRTDGWARAPWNHKGYRIGLCQLCEKLYALNGQQLDDGNVISTASAAQPFPSIIPDVVKWFTDECACDEGQFVKKWVG